MDSQQTCFAADSGRPELADGPANHAVESAWEVAFSAALANGLLRAERTVPARPAATSGRSRRNGKKPRQVSGAVVGKLLGHSDMGAPLVVFPGCSTKQGMPARTTVPCKGALGQEVVLIFERGDPCKPIILGLLQSHPPDPVPAPLPIQAIIDGERLVFTAEKEIVLRCGNASLTLTQAGKVLLQGAYVSSRASGVNRIKGGSVQIN